MGRGSSDIEALLRPPTLAHRSPPDPREIDLTALRSKLALLGSSPRVGDVEALVSQARDTQAIELKRELGAAVVVSQIDLQRAQMREDAISYGVKWDTEREVEELADRVGEELISDRELPVGEAIQRAVSGLDWEEQLRRSKIGPLCWDLVARSPRAFYQPNNILSREPLYRLLPRSPQDASSNELGFRKLLIWAGVSERVRPLAHRISEDIQALCCHSPDNVILSVPERQLQQKLCEMISVSDAPCLGPDASDGWEWFRSVAGDWASERVAELNTDRLTSHHNWQNGDFLRRWTDQTGVEISAEHWAGLAAAPEKNYSRRLVRALCSRAYRRESGVSERRRALVEMTLGLREID